VSTEFRAGAWRWGAFQHYKAFRVAVQPAWETSLNNMVGLPCSGVYGASCADLERAPVVSARGPLHPASGLIFRQTGPAESVFEL
jgi:hypothetical protein